MGEQVASATAIHTGDRLGWRLSWSRLIFILFVAHVSIQALPATKLAGNSVKGMRVVAGELRGRRINAPLGKKTRPTTDKAREATFNALGSLGVVVGARVIDAFAGSGALGIEALSRGAEHCTFIERDREALEVLRENLETLGLVEKSTVVRGDVLTNIALVRNASLVLADPPYEFKQWSQFLGEVACDLVVAESDRDMNDEISGVNSASPAIIGWEVTRVKRYGRAYVSFLQRLA
jgi:16S rRNA (guanine966-N2)-methyltransferase